MELREIYSDKGDVRERERERAVREDQNLMNTY